MTHDSMYFSHLATVFEQIEQTTSRISMTELLAALFKQTSAEEIGNVCYLLQGRVVPLYEAVEFGMADKFMIRAIAMAYEVSNDEVIAGFRKAGDLGSAAQAVSSQSLATSKLTINNVFVALKQIAEMGGEGSQEKKITFLADLFKQLDPLSVRYIVRIPLGKLRLGFSDMTILDSLSWMITGDKTLRVTLEEIYNVRPDIGVLATTVKKEGVEGLKKITAIIGTPILSALCQRIPTAQEMIDKMGEVSCEGKYDGVRVQIHYNGKGFKTFSRNLENTTQMFPELSQIKQEVNAESFILDCEAVGVDPQSGKILPFQETTKRKRKHNIEETQKSIPLKFYVFDILYKNGKGLLSEPLSKRKEILEQTVTPQTLLALSPYIVTQDPALILQCHEQQRKLGLEGIVVKKWQGLYESGRRSYNWVKLKETEGNKGKLKDTIDTVVMGYYYGEGKRSGFGIGAFLVGVRQGESIVTVTKIGTGVSDDLWKELLVSFDKLKVTEQPKQYENVSKMLLPDVWLNPGIVVEIAGDDLTKSPNHGAGYAVRFPRLIKVRTDKSLEQATTVEEIAEMFKSQ